MRKLIFLSLILSLRAQAAWLACPFAMELILPHHPKPTLPSPAPAPVPVINRLQARLDELGSHHGWTPQSVHDFYDALTRIENASSGRPAAAFSSTDALKITEAAVSRNASRRAALATARNAASENAGRGLRSDQVAALTVLALRYGPDVKALSRAFAELNQIGASDKPGAARYPLLTGQDSLAILENGLKQHSLPSTVLAARAIADGLGGWNIQSGQIRTLMRLKRRSGLSEKDLINHFIRLRFAYGSNDSTIEAIQNYLFVDETKVVIKSAKSGRNYLVERTTDVHGQTHVYEFLADGAIRHSINGVEFRCTRQFRSPDPCRPRSRSRRREIPAAVARARVKVRRR